MASELKHKKRSMRRSLKNRIPLGMFYNYAQRVYQAKQMRETAKINLETQNVEVE